MASWPTVLFPCILIGHFSPEQLSIYWGLQFLPLWDSRWYHCGGFCPRFCTVLAVVHLCTRWRLMFDCFILNYSVSVVSMNMYDGTNAVIYGQWWLSISFVEQYLQLCPDEVAWKHKKCWFLADTPYIWATCMPIMFIYCIIIMWYKIDVRIFSFMKFSMFF